MSATHPPVSCMCLTYARPKHILEEAVYSFLNQDYAGDKELLILNDFDRATIEFAHPQVTIVNLATRFHSLGEKRNAAAALCRYDLLAVWDDDDIFLPHRLSFSVAHYDARRRFFKPSKALFLDRGVLGGPEANLFHSGGLWHRSLFDEVGGYDHINSGQDLDIELKFAKVIGFDKNLDAIAPADIFYLYRWSDTDSYHMSAFGRDTDGRSGHAEVKRYADREVERGKVPTGRVALEPHWKHDYVRMTRNYVATLTRPRIAPLGSAEARG
jgi:glycosyl transferase family 2